MKQQSVGAAVLWRCILGLIVVVLAAPTGVAAERQLTVRGTGVVFAEPDMAEVRVGVTTQGADATSAMQANAASAGAIIAALRDLGIAPEDVQTAAVSLAPEFDRPEPGSREQPRVVGYRASNNIQVTVRDLSALGDLLDTLVRAGATDIGRIRLTSSELEMLMDDALALAMGRARDKAKRLSAAAGVELGEVLSISEQFARGPGPVPLAAQALADAPVPIAPGQQRIEASVTVTYALRANLRLAGSEWRPTEIDGTPVAAEPAIFLQFDGDGEVNGNSGCNRFFGTFTLDGDAIAFGPIGTTRMACPQPVMDLELAFLTTLEKAATFARDRIHLSLFDAAGNTIMKLKQTDPD